MDELREKIEAKAREIDSWLQDAVGDMSFDPAFLDDEWQEKVRRAKKRGVRDIQGWLADEFYNDVDTIRDLTGDRIHDAATQLVSFKNPKHGECMIEICKVMKRDNENSPISKAMNRIIKDQKKFLKEYYYDKKKL